MPPAPRTPKRPTTWALLALLAAALACSGPQASPGAPAPGPPAATAEPAPVRPEASPVTGAEAGAPAAAEALVDCTPSKILCRRRAPECPQGQVPSVQGSCYGPCVAIERCGCAAAEACPQPDRYTCWGKQHCGPYVR